MQEEQERALAVAVEKVNPPSVELLVPSPLTPRGHTGGQPHRYRPFFFFLAL